MKKILLTGGSGLLGQEIQHLYDNILAPSHKEMDITNKKICEKHLLKYTPDIVLHAAAFTSPPRCDNRPDLARQTNILGTVNLIDLCQEHSTRFVYISTDYVFDGTEGRYKTTDSINPINIYSMTKAAGELATKTYNNSLIIRTSFCEHIFPYEKAFVDQYTSRDYVDIIAPIILNHTLSEMKGVVHVGTERKTIFELARRRKINIGKLKRSEMGFKIPKDTSFFINKRGVYE